MLICGQDESTFHQYCFSKIYWKSPDGKSFIQPKGTGDILMVSGFQSRVCGLGLGPLLTPKVLEEINKTRNNKNIVHQKVLLFYINR